MAIPGGPPERPVPLSVFHGLLQHGRILEQGTDHDGLHQLDGDEHHDGGQVQPTDIGEGKPFADPVQDGLG